MGHIDEVNELVSQLLKRGESIEALEAQKKTTVNSAKIDSVVASILEYQSQLEEVNPGVEI